VLAKTRKLERHMNLNQLSTLDQSGLARSESPRLPAGPRDGNLRPG